MLIMNDHVVTAVFEGTVAVSVDSRSQYDYGQVLKIEGITLPQAFEAHFCNTEDGESITQIGTDNQVPIPDEFFVSGQPVYVWIFVHDEVTDGRTKYRITIPVRRRAEITDQEPTPQEQSAITQAIAALDAAVEQSETNVTHYPKIVDEYWWVWDAVDEEWVNTGIDALGVDGEDGVSPIITTHRTPTGYEIAITDADGTKTVQLDDGISPDIGVQSIQGGHRVTMTDAEGSHVFDVPDGRDGTDGRDGVDGRDGRDGVDGYTPHISVAQSGRIRIVTITDEDGSKNYQVLDGVSPLIAPAPITGGYKLTIYDADGSRSVNIYHGLPGETGQDGAPGRDGVSPTVSEIPTSDGYIVQITDATGTHEFALVNGQDGQDGEPGQDGVDGVSPEIYVNDITGGHEVTVVDAQGETSFDVLDGADGVSPSIGVTPLPGGYEIEIEDATGTSTVDLYNGQDGYSPTVTVTPITGGHQVDIEDGEGTHSFDVMDGATGATGAAGHTPVKGTDYWTAQDQQDIVDDVVAEVVKVVTVSGTTPTITGVANTRYVCGEVSTLSITPPASGIIDVLFTSGSTKTVLTLPSTVQMPSGFDTEPDTVYEISIMDGVYGAVMSWEVSA